MTALRRRRRRPPAVQRGWPRRRLTTLEHVDDARGSGRERGGGGLGAQPHQVGREDDVRVVEQRVVLRRLGVEHVQPDAAEPTGDQRLEGRVVVDQRPPAAVHQDGAGSGERQPLGVQQVVGLGRERQVQGDDVAAGQQLLEGAAAHPAGGLATGS